MKIKFTWWKILLIISTLLIGYYFGLLAGIGAYLVFIGIAAGIERNF